MRRLRLTLQAGLKGAGHSCTLRVLEPTLPKSQKKKGARGSLLSSSLSENGWQLHHAAHAWVASGGWPCRFRWCQARVLISVLAALLFRSLNLRSLDRLAICSPFQVGQQTGTICGNRNSCPSLNSLLCPTLESGAFWFLFSCYAATVSVR